MRQILPTIAILICFALLANTNAQGDSLRSALRAMSQRQKDLGGYDNLYYYNDDANEVPLLKDYMDRYGNGKNDRPDRTNYDYIDEPEIQKKMSSSFRERMAEEERINKMEETAKAMLLNMENNDISENYDDKYLKELWDRYNNDAAEYPYYINQRSNKRVFYPTYAVENIGLRKRSKYMGNNNDDFLFNYNQRIPREGDDNEYPEYSRNRYYRRSNDMNHHHYKNKRFFVAKRSSNNYKTADEKRSVKKQTDPRVEKELSNIFSGANQPNLKENKITPIKPLPTNPPTTKLPAVDLKKNVVNTPPNINKTKTTQNLLNKEVFSPVAPVHERPMKNQKKSINWSDYFGIDRRKKSENSGLDKDWLMERYHKAVAITAKKRNAEMPLNFFRKHDETANPEDKFSNSVKGKLDEEKIDEFSSTLKNMEEKMIGDALKYTGAHQGETDSVELQKVKDNIINSLAAAYNFEKMRNALEEYKNSVETEKAKLKQEGKLSDDYIYEEKRVSVPRKEAVDEMREIGDGDNNIKCTTAEDCHEQNYKTPADVLENHLNGIVEQCPLKQKACNALASSVGHFGHVFEGACNIYQTCLLCTSNSWFSPTRHCNTLFLDKAYEMCLGKEECQKEAQNAIHYMLDINKALQTEYADECDFTCPTNDQFVTK